MNIIRANKFNKLFIRKNCSTEEKASKVLEKTCNIWILITGVSTFGGACLGL